MVVRTEGELSLSGKYHQLHSGGTKSGTSCAFLEQWVAVLERESSQASPISPTKKRRISFWFVIGTHDAGGVCCIWYRVSFPIIISDGGAIEVLSKGENSTLFVVSFT